MTDAAVCSAGQQQHLRNDDDQRPTHTHCCCHDSQHTTDCTDETCPGCVPARATHGNLCGPCYGRAANAYEDLPRLWQEMAHHLAPGSAAGQNRISGTPETPNALNAAIYEHRRNIEDTLAEHLDNLADNLGHHRPRNTRYPPTTAPWLRTRLDLAADQDWAGTLVLEVTGLTRRAHQLLNPSGRRRLRRIGHCSHDDCQGTVTARLAPADDTLPPSLVCDLHPEHEVPSTEWIRAYEKAEKRQKREEAA